MSPQLQDRQPTGVPSGSQFSATTRTEADTALQAQVVSDELLDAAAKTLDPAPWRSNHPSSMARREMRRDDVRRVLAVWHAVAVGDGESGCLCDALTRCPVHDGPTDD